MNKNQTTSIRLTPQLRQQLDCLSLCMHRGRNWIISQALQEYMYKNQHHTLAIEARRQSLIASQQTNTLDEDWHNSIDDSDWHAS